jgi:hypothetical protein
MSTVQVILQDNHTQGHSLLGLLVQLIPVLLQNVLRVMMGGQETDIVNLGPATLLEAQKMGLAPKDGLESLKSS